MPGRLEGKVCVITGAASGIGAETAKLFADEGAHVVGVDLKDDADTELALSCDVADEGQVIEMYDRAHREFGRLDVLFNNAGIVHERDQFSVEVIEGRVVYNPDAAEQQNYALTVADKTERSDPGFAYHGVPARGEKNAQVEPKFAGPIPRQFPFSDDDIRSRRVTVATILSHYRQVYAPAAGSPLLGAGDPADGRGSYIGAVAPSP